MTPQRAVQIIRQKLEGAGGTAKIPMLKRRGGRTHFTATLRERGIDVDNLHLQPFLPWSVFETAVRTLHDNSGRAMKGSAQKYKLGESGLPLNSIEGRVASEVYGVQPGGSVFRRITPISCILEWAGVCRNSRGELVLVCERDAS